MFLSSCGFSLIAPFGFGTKTQPPVYTGLEHSRVIDEHKTRWSSTEITIKLFIVLECCLRRLIGYWFVLVWLDAPS